MKNRGVRVALCALVALAFIAAAYEIARLEQRANATRGAARVFNDRAARMEAAIAELRSAQFAYVAEGQGSAFWTGKATDLLTELTNELPTLQQEAGAADSQARLKAMPAALATIKQIDGSIQGYVRNEQRLLASDLIFSDLREAVDGFRGGVVQARASERVATDAALLVNRETQLATVAGAAIFALLVLVLLVPRTGTRRASEPPHPTIPTIAPPLDAPTDLPLVLDKMPVAETWPPSTSDRVDLSEAAALCTAFARVAESRQLPALLERVARLLNAVGVIVWIDDPVSGELRPALCHGYSAQALARIGGLSKNADNATASAFRDRTVRVVVSDSGNGAIAVPILSASGCVGVMAAEVPAGVEGHPAAQALARIVAAQLSTLVSTQGTGTGPA